MQRSDLTRVIADPVHTGINQSELSIVNTNLILTNRSTSEMEAQLGYHEHDHLRHGYSYGDIHSDYPPPDDYYCKYQLLE